MIENPRSVIILYLEGLLSDKAGWLYARTAKVFRGGKGGSAWKTVTLLFFFSSEASKRTLCSKFHGFVELFDFFLNLLCMSGV